MELHLLQREMLAHRHKVAPLPLAEARKLRQELLADDRDGLTGTVIDVDTVLTRRRIGAGVHLDSARAEVDDPVDRDSGPCLTRQFLALVIGEASIRYHWRKVHSPERLPVPVGRSMMENMRPIVSPGVAP